jgi:hypothetical protein
MSAKYSILFSLPIVSINLFKSFLLSMTTGFLNDFNLVLVEAPNNLHLTFTSYGSSSPSSLINKNIRPIVNSTGKGTATFGQVVSVDTNNNKITIQYNNKGFSLWKSSYTKYELDVAIGTTKTIAITSGQLTHFKTPALQTNINVVAGDQNEVVNFNTKTLLRVKKDTVVSYLPDSAIFNSIQVSGTLSTENIIDVDSKLVDLETRIQTLEQKLGI